MDNKDSTHNLNLLIGLIKGRYLDTSIALHRPVFEGNERRYLVDCVDSNFVSSVGSRVSEFEKQIADFTGSAFAVATVNGTAALHAAMVVADVRPGDEVLTQALTFVATCNAINYMRARPVFIDVDHSTMGMSPNALRRWLELNTLRDSGYAINKSSGARLSACIPMHTFGMPCRISEISEICEEFGICLIEDAAESLGSTVGGQHTGTFGRLAAISFNGNKIITTGGGGMIITNDEALAHRARHLTTTAKRAHPFEFFHDQIGFNYRMPNLNAALGSAQIEKLPIMIEIKTEIAAVYRDFCNSNGLNFMDAISGTQSNHWLNAILLRDRIERDAFLETSNAAGVMTRPIWRLMNELPMFTDCEHDGLKMSKFLVDRIVNLPSSVPESEFHRLS